MNQITLTDMEYYNRKKKTKREEFLDAMEKIILWSYWVDMIRPYYFSNKRGRRPTGIENIKILFIAKNDYMILQQRNIRIIFLIMEEI